MCSRKEIVINLLGFPFYNSKYSEQLGGKDIIIVNSKVLYNDFCKKILLSASSKKILIFVFERKDCCHKNNNHHNRYDNIDFRQSQEKKRFLMEESKNTVNFRV